MDNLSKDVAAALRLGYGCHYGRYKVDHPNTADRSADLPLPDPRDDKPLPRCKHCGKVFRQRDGHQVFCSEECRLDRRRLMNRLNKKDYERHSIGEAVCPACGKTFPKMRQTHIYCGRSCAAVVRNQNRRKKV